MPRSGASGRLELLRWLNEFLGSDYTRVEQLGDGVAFAQIIDAVYPGKIQLHTLNLNAKYPVDKLGNLEIVERAMKKCGVKRTLLKQELARGVFQHNLDMLQWSRDFIYQHSHDAKCTDIVYRHLTESQRKKTISKSTSSEGNAIIVSNNVDIADSTEWATTSGAELSEVQVNEQSERSSSRSSSNSSSTVEELITLLQEELSFQLSSQQPLLDSVLQLQAERDFYLGKLIKLESIVVNALKSVMKSSSSEIDSSIAATDDSHNANPGLYSKLTLDKMLDALRDSTPIFKPLESALASSSRF